jgi:hypothetical protein
LTDDAILVFHDVKYHTTQRTQAGITNNLLMSSITGEKILQGNSLKVFPNIAGIKINLATKKNIFEIFNLLTIKWSYLPTDEQEKEIIAHFAKFYDKYYLDYLKNVFAYQKELTKNDKKYSLKDIAKRILGRKNIAKIKKFLKKRSHPLVH